jgi:hypothetical protein
VDNGFVPMGHFWTLQLFQFRQGSEKIFETAFAVLI